MKILSVWNFIIKQVCFIDKQAYDNQVLENHKLRFDNIKEIIHNINPYIIIYLYIDYNIINYKNINKYEIFCDMIDNQYNLYKINGNNTLQNIINTIMYIIK